MIKWVDPSLLPDEPYAVVLRDLRAYRDKIDALIAALEAVRSSRGGTLEPETKVTNPDQPLEDIGGRGTVRTSDPYDVNV